MAKTNSWVTRFQGYDQNVRLFFLSTIFIQMGMGIYMVMYNFYIRELGLQHPEKVIGMVVSIYSLATAIFLIPAGWCSDRFSRKKIFVLSILSSSVLFAFRAICVTEYSLYVTAFLMGATISFLQVSSLPWLAEHTTNEQRVQLFSEYFALMTAIQVIGNLGGGILSDIFRMVFSVSPVVSVRMTLLIAAVLFGIGVFPLFKTTEKTKQEVEREKKASLSMTKEDLYIVFIFFSIQLLIGVGSGLVIPFLNIYFADRFSVSTSMVALVISLGQVMTAIAIMIGPVLVSKVGEARAVIIFQLLSIPFLLITGFTNHFIIAVIAFLFRQALMNAANPIQNAIIMSRVKDSLKGFANSLSQLTFSIGWAAMPPISMQIVKSYGIYDGYATIFTITAVLYSISSIAFFFVFRENGLIDRKFPQKMSQPA